MADVVEPEKPDYRVRRSELGRSVSESAGWSVYDAIVDRVDWSRPRQWRSVLDELNDAQRVVVAAGHVREHAACNGVEVALAFHGADVVRLASESAARLGFPLTACVLADALQPDPDWDQLEARWDAEGFVELESPSSSSTRPTSSSTSRRAPSSVLADHRLLVTVFRWGGVRRARA